MSRRTQQQVKLRLSGAEMRRRRGWAAVDVKKLKIEKFDTNGVLEGGRGAPVHLCAAGRAWRVRRDIWS